MSSKPFFSKCSRIFQNKTKVFETDIHVHMAWSGNKITVQQWNIKKASYTNWFFFLLWTKDWWCEGRIEQVKVQKPHSYLMKISMSNYGTCNRTLACITSLQSNYSLTQTHNITLNGLLFWSQLTEPCWHLLQFTITELYLGIFYNSDHTNKTLHWHVFAILGPHLKNLKNQM